MIHYLLVDSRNERGLDAHAQGHADVVELMEEERIQDGCQEEHCRKHVPLPFFHHNPVLLLHERNQLPVTVAMVISRNTMLDLKRIFSINVINIFTTIFNI